MEGTYVCEGRTEAVTVTKKGRGYTVTFEDGTIAPLQWVQRTHKLTAIQPDTKPPVSETNLPDNEPEAA